MSEVRNYEAVLICKELNRDAQTVAFDALYNNLEKRGAEILQKENWGVKELFHPSSKVTRGNFNFLRFNIIGEQIKNIYSELKLDTNVLKAFISKVPRGK